MLHIARKAGKLVMGRTAVLEARKRDKDLLALVASDAGSDLMRKLEAFDMIRIDLNSDRLGEIFGREKLSLVGITDRGIAAAVRRLVGTGLSRAIGSAGRNKI